MGSFKPPACRRPPFLAVIAYRNLPGLVLSSGLARRTLLAFLLFLVAVGVFGLQGTVATSLQERARYYLAAEESDWSKDLKRVVETVLWLDPVERQAMRYQEALGPPLVIPVSGQVVRSFGWAASPAGGKQTLHGGLDIAVGADSLVRASLAGRVLDLGSSPEGGRSIELEHGGGLSTYYANLGEILVQEGEQVKAGQFIGKLTDGKKSSLHFEVRHDGRPVNPVPYLSGSPQKI